MNPTDPTRDTGVAARGVVRTFGEIFADGSLLELVASENGSELNLLLSNRTRIVIAPQIKYRGKIYKAGELHPSILRATRLPREAIGYGTIRQLLAELAGTFEEFLAFSRPASELTAFWVLTSWFPDCLSSPPALWISGVDIGRAASFLRLLHCLCRRALKVAGITRSGFLALPVGFSPYPFDQPTNSVGWNPKSFPRIQLPRFSCPRGPRCGC